MNQRREGIVDEVRAGLSAPARQFSPKFFYDALGSKLFEAITLTKAYYPTRCELGILTEHGAAIAEVVGPGVVLLELGSGQSTKVPLLLEQLTDVRAYVPVDIDATTLKQAARRLRRQFPGLVVLPVAVDFFQPWSFPTLPERERTVVFYPGSTIGNLDPERAEVFLRDLADRLEPGDGLLIGVDLEKDPAVLELAYDDPAGVTAAFNKNMLAHLNHLVGTDFDPRRFTHVATFDPELHCMQIYLRSEGVQRVRLGDETFRFEDGELLHTESSYKYSRERFGALAERAGFVEEHFWTDADGWFGVTAFTRR